MLLAVVSALALGVSAFVFLVPTKKGPEAKADSRATYRLGKSVEFKRAQDAVFRGIVAEKARADSWQPKIFVDGRVLPNPQATLEVRAPFAGILRLEPNASPPWRLGAPVQAVDTLVKVEGRFNSTERLDLKSKLVDAEERRQKANDVLKIRQDAMAQMEKLSSGILSQPVVDAALVQLAEARMEQRIAERQWDIWKRALEQQAMGEKTIAVPIATPMAGEITEIGAQPNANVEAGQLIARIVDFDRVLLRLDFPLESGTPKPIVNVEADGSASWPALRRGPAPSVEIGLQKASYLYEIMPAKPGASPRWRPGLYVKAVLDDPAKSVQSAVSFPASALLIHQGRTLVYVQQRVGLYHRREVELLGRSGDTLYVAGGVHNDEWVVTKGAQVLLSEEFRSDVDDD
jgi:hypothetical protein